MIKTLKRIPPLQFAKVSGIIYGLMALIFVPVFILIAIVGSFAPHQEAGFSVAALGLTFGIIMSLVVPVFYAVVGFIFGLIGAAFYNLIAKWVGGIQVEVE